MTLTPESLIPAPGRGRYDRSLSRERRQAQQRERVLAGVAAAFGAGRRQVSAVVELSGIGRNTFYEYFDDFEHALEALRTRALARLSGALTRALSGARTPLERVRASCRAFWQELAERPLEALVVLDRTASTGERPLSPAGGVLSRALLESSRTARGESAGDATRALAVAAAAEALFLSRSAAERDAPGKLDQLAGVKTLIDVAVRVLA